jgi:hypothetical protein
VAVRSPEPRLRWNLCGCLSGAPVNRIEARTFAAVGGLGVAAAATLGVVALSSSASAAPVAPHVAATASAYPPVVATTSAVSPPKSVDVLGTSTSRAPAPGIADPGSTGGSGGPGDLPFTGADVAGISIVGAALVGGGSFLVVAGRRRRGAHR